VQNEEEEKNCTNFRLYFINNVYTTGTDVDGTLAVDKFQISVTPHHHTGIRDFTAADVPKWDRKKDEKIHHRAFLLRKFLYQISNLNVYVVIIIIIIIISAYFLLRTKRGFFRKFVFTRISRKIILTLPNSRNEILCKDKCKTNPLQAWTGLEGSRRLRLPDFKTIRT